MKAWHAVLGIVLILGACSYSAYEVIRMDKLIAAGAKMSISTNKYERTIDDKNEILILGDSLAYGVGSTDPENSFAGILAKIFEDKSIKNYAVIGETIGSLEKSIGEKVTSRYERIYIIVGGNDIMRLHINIFSSKESLIKLIESATQMSDSVVLITTGDFDNVSLSPWILKGVFNMRANLIRNKALDLEGSISNFDYVDFKSAGISKSEYKILEAPDGFHLNEQGIQKLVSVMLDS